MSFVEIDHAQRLSSFKSGGSSGDGGLVNGAGKRNRDEGTSGIGASLASSSSNSNDNMTANEQYYDPSVPRTGRWTDEEIAFRDTLITHFLEGSLPLPNGLKLIDFLSDMLKSKQSRLTKKMKHAKLSAKHFFLDSGNLGTDVTKATTLSNLESSFYNSISDPIERSEIKFHMHHRWRDHVAERCNCLRIAFDGCEWIKSVEKMEHRVSIGKNKSRMVRRRFMMGKAMETDVGDSAPGVFIDQNYEGDLLGVGDGVGGATGNEDFDFDLVMSALEGEGGGATTDMQSAYMSLVGGDSFHAASESGMARRLLSLTHPSSEVSQLMSASSSNVPQYRPSSSEPNFRFAAPFLAWITSYMERNGIPFEHVDIWVPSSSMPFQDPTGASAPQPPMGSGSQGTVMRLCFAGSASLGSQVVGQPDAVASALTLGKVGVSAAATVPLSSDEIESLSLFGSYSEKFSFSNGSGLPGRVFQSGVPAWEQFIANAPPALFERRGGAMQFGIKTALGLPIKSPNVGRIVCVMYSKHNRDKSDELVGKLLMDIQSMNPCPRLKLVVEMGNANDANAVNNGSSVGTGFVGLNQPMEFSTGGIDQSITQYSSLVQKKAMNVDQIKSGQIKKLISFLGENMPSDHTTQLGQQVHSIMSLRLILLRTNRTPDEEHLVDSLLVLFESYLSAGRTSIDTTLMLARDFAFHSSHVQQMSMMNNLSIQQNSSPLLQSVPEQTQHDGYVIPCDRERSQSFSLTSIDHSQGTNRLERSQSVSLNALNYSTSDHRLGSSPPESTTFR